MSCNLQYHHYHIEIHIVFCFCGLYCPVLGHIPQKSGARPRYLELAEDAEDLGEGSRYREHPIVRVPCRDMDHMDLEKSGEILEGLAVEHVGLILFYHV